MKRLLMVLVAVLLAGCSAGSTKWDSAAMDHTKLAFVGVPTLLGVGYAGTTTPITPEYSLTNNHVATGTLRRVEKRHAFCDLALIRQNNVGEKFPRLRPAKIGEKVTIYGYSGRTSLPVSGTGVVRGGGYRDGCYVMVTTAGSIQGMSGGGVFGEDGALVGIFYMLMPFKSLSVFVPVQSFGEVKA